MTLSSHRGVRYPTSFTQAGLHFFNVLLTQLPIPSFDLLQCLALLRVHVLVYGI